jgi:hypothetical protein
MNDYVAGPRRGECVVVLWDHGRSNPIWSHIVHDREAGIRNRLAVE